LSFHPEGNAASPFIQNFRNISANVYVEHSPPLLFNVLICSIVYISLNWACVLGTTGNNGTQRASRFLFC